MELPVRSESVASIRSRPGSSESSCDVKAPVEEGHAIEVKTLGPIPVVKVTTVTLIDRSTYHGEVKDGIPDGVGVLLSVFGVTYSGAMKEGKKHGAGVEMQTNGTTYSGEFRDGVASGYGVHIGTLEEEYIGQWEDGARHGVGVSVDAKAVMMASHFSMDEPSEVNIELSWEQDVQPHVVCALLAEKAAVRNQEIARERHIDAVVHDMTAIGADTLNTLEAIEAFETKEELKTAEFIRAHSDQMRQVGVTAGELKFSEAQLTQDQKVFRAEITAKQQELALVAKYCALVETRETQVRKAERTLATLQRQLNVLDKKITNPTVYNAF